MPTLTVEDMVNGVSMIRNPVIVRVFRELRLIEEWGSGVRGVIRTLTEQGLGAPEFLELPGRLRVVIPIRNHQPRITAEPGTTRGTSEQVSEQVAALLHATAAPTARAELLAALGLSNAYGNYQRHIVPLLERGWLAMTIPDKPNSRLQRYQTTDAGRVARTG